MNKLVLTLAAATAFAALPVYAETALTDANADGVYSYEELLVSYPDLSQADFDAADADQSGALDADEIAAAKEAGQLPA
ncbi:hypothetical protein [Pararhodobacter sp.]|uniref:hypothetical protein n=1 Tax=Pararhodobacter sp. TaxID=2127056 RepID=UPI002AFE5023|nr:hypothetical protein [Pararhodobacter sp.]